METVQKFRRKSAAPRARSRCDFIVLEQHCYSDWTPNMVMFNRPDSYSKIISLNIAEQIVS